MHSNESPRDARASTDWVRFSRRSALAVLSAASASPTAAFRQSLMATAAVALHRRDVDGTVVASAEDLAELLATGAAQASPAAFDSYEPLDVRLGVRARWRQGLRASSTIRKCAARR